jgi:hypothetical protein
MLRDGEGLSPCVYTVGMWDGNAKLTLSSENNGKRFGMVRLGARRNGADYASEDTKNLSEAAQLVPEAIALAERAARLAR